MDFNGDRFSFPVHAARTDSHRLGIKIGWTRFIRTTVRTCFTPASMFTQTRHAGLQASRGSAHLSGVRPFGEMDEQQFHADRLFVFRPAGRRSSTVNPGNVRATGGSQTADTPRANTGGRSQS